MSSGARRLLLLSAAVLGLLGALEVLCRVEAEGLAAISHRVRFKLALLHGKGDVAFVALGSSRSNDGLAPAALGLGEGFSAATPSSSLATLEYMATHLGAQKLVLVELSRPQWDPQPLELDAVPPTDFTGDPLGEWLHAHSVLLRVRRGFALENLPRVAGLLLSKQLDGSEWFRSRQLVEMFRPAQPPPGVADDAAWAPAPPTADPALLDADSPRVVDGYVRALEALKKTGARVVLVAPPLAMLWRVEDCAPPMNALRAEVVRRTGAPVVDFTCAAVDDRWFVDGQHLSSPGRARYSKALGEALRALP